MSTSSTVTLQKIKRVTLADGVIQQITDMIRTGALQPGSRLPFEHELMKMLGVGRTPVREGLQALALAGLIEIRPGYGSTVKQLEFTMPEPVEKASAAVRIATLQHLTEARQMLEGEIAAAAAERATPEDLDHLHSILDRCERAIEHSQSPYKVAAYFHVDIAETTRNTVLIRLMHSLVGFMVEGGRQTHVPGYMRWELDAHREVLRAIRSRDPQLARKAMKHHIAEASARRVFPNNEPKDQE